MSERHIDDGGFVGTLYGHALDRSPDDLPAWALPQLAALLAADGAAWVMLRNDGAAPSCAGWHGAPAPAVIAALQQLAVFSGTRMCDLADAAPEHAALREAGARHLLLGGCAHAGTLFTSLIALSRGRGGAPFTCADAQGLQALLPHLVNAQQLAQRSHMKLDTLLRRAGRPNRGLGCLCDRGGAIFAMSEEFAEAIAQRYPQWDRLRVPFLLPAPASGQHGRRQDGFTVKGMHLRVEQRAGWSMLYLRSLHAFDELTLRERDVVKAMVRGHSFKALAQDLGVSASTIANHASNIYRKLGVYSRDDVVELSRQSVRAA